MFWKKKKKEPVRLQIPTATELRAIMDKKQQIRLEYMRTRIAEQFLDGNHPYHNFDAMWGSGFENDLIDKLKPELEALGYEILVRTAADSALRSDKVVEYREVRIKQ